MSRLTYALVAPLLLQSFAVALPADFPPDSQDDCEADYRPHLTPPAERLSSAAVPHFTSLPAGLASSLTKAEPTTSSDPVSSFVSSTFSTPSPTATPTVSSASQPSSLSIAKQALSSSSSSSSASLPPSTVRSAASSSTGTHPLTPNGIKAGSAGGNLVPFIIDHIGWWYDWTPEPTPTGSPVAVPMLWGVGDVDTTDATRLQEFKDLTSIPAGYVLGFEEPDCPSGGGSAGYVSPADGAKVWDEQIAKWAKDGVMLGSPSMCKQADEDWLSPFDGNVTTSWDFTAIHVNKLDSDGIQKDIDHYWNTYKKPIWVTEFACVNDVNGFKPCDDQSQIDTFINTAVDLFESNEHVFAYGYSDGEGLGDLWKPVKDGALTDSGKTYLKRISLYH